ncbi:MAG: rod shape-determining protein MreD [Fibrobacterales bacterium]|nr:rod shape-determining protein MreD [Fibrobacterales bacterium]
MKALLLVLLALFLLTLQTTMQDVLSIFGTVPDFLLLFLVAVALKHGPVAGVWCGLFLGVAQDAYATSGFGADAMALTIVGYAVGFAEEQVLKLDTITKILLLALAFFGRLALHGLFCGADAARIGASLLEGGLAQGALTLLLGSVWFVVFSRDRQV